MKKIYEQADQLVIEGQIIADNLGQYSPGLSKERIPLEAIQHDVAILMQRYSRVYADIGEKIKCGAEY